RRGHLGKNQTNPQPSTPVNNFHEKALSKTENICASPLALLPIERTGPSNLPVVRTAAVAKAPEDWRSLRRFARFAAGSRARLDATESRVEKFWVGLWFP